MNQEQWRAHVLDSHRGGKLAVQARMPLATREDLAVAYTPGVALVSERIARDPEAAWELTGRGNAVAVVSDGSAVLGLGAVGPLAALPVMEGKAVLFKTLAGIDAYPVVLNVAGRDRVEEIVSAVQAFAPGFGGINLEDIAAPWCFEIERRLTETLDIPVFHDDQHGTAVVVLAALRNAARATGRDLAMLRVVVVGAGAAGSAIARLLQAVEVADIVLVDREGTLHAGRRFESECKAKLARETNPRELVGGVAEALVGAHVLIGVSARGVVDPGSIATMAEDAIVFALANPDPEIEAHECPPNVRIFATGRSGDEQQINNVLAFPGIFRGLLNARATDVGDDIKLAAAGALAGLVSDAELAAGKVIPSPLDERCAPAVAHAVETVILAR